MPSIPFMCILGALNGYLMPSSLEGVPVVARLWVLAGLFSLLSLVSEAWKDIASQHN